MSVQSIAREYIGMLPIRPGMSPMPMPQFVQVNMLSARWNGIAIWDHETRTCQIKLQKRIMADEKTQRRIIAHEICHAYAYHLAYKDMLEPPARARGHESNGIWYQAAQIINGRTEPDFITEHSDESYAEQSEKRFFILLTRSNNGQVMWHWFARLTDQAKARLHHYIMDLLTRGNKVAIVRTDDARFADTNKPPFPRVYRHTQMNENFEAKANALLDEHALTADFGDINALLNRIKTSNLHTSNSLYDLLTSLLSE